MTTVFQTESGSTYELDREQRCLRRIEGMTDPTPRVGKDGDWRLFQDVSAIVEGAHVVIVWAWDLRPGTENDPLDPGEVIARSTVTSKVVSVRELQTPPGV